MLLCCNGTALANGLTTLATGLMIDWKEIEMEGKLPTLRIYVARHCESCAEALSLAEEVRRKYTTITVEVVDLDAEGGHNPDDVFSVPTYVLNGKIISLGNPSPVELEMRLSCL